MKQADSVGAAGATLLPKAGAVGGSGGDGGAGEVTAAAAAAAAAAASAATAVVVDEEEAPRVPGPIVPGVDGLELFQGVITEELEATLIAEVDRLLVLGEEGKLVR